MIFRREISAACSARLGCTTSRSVPSTRKRTERVALVGLDVDVAGAVLGGLRQQRVEHADDRRVVRGFEQVLDRRQVLHQARQVDRALDLADHRRRARLAAGVDRRDALRQRGRGLALESRDVVQAQHLRQRRRRRPLAAHSDELLAVVFEQQRVRLGEARRAGGGGRPCVSRPRCFGRRAAAPGASAPADAVGQRSIGGTGSAAAQPAAAAARPALVDRHHDALPRLPAPCCCARIRS